MTVLRCKKQRKGSKLARAKGRRGCALFVRWAEIGNCSTSRRRGRPEKKGYLLGKAGTTQGSLRGRNHQKSKPARLEVPGQDWDNLYRCRWRSRQGQSLLTVVQMIRRFYHQQEKMRHARGRRSRVILILVAADLFLTLRGGVVPGRE